MGAPGSALVQKAAPSQQVYTDMFFLAAIYMFDQGAP